MRTLAMLMILAVPVSAAPRSLAVARFADGIVRLQAPDGAIVMNRLGLDDNRVVPYFANLAAIGLVTAARDTGDKRYVTSARRWADWYAAHMNTDGTVYDHTGKPGAWVPTGDYDSTDSYAGTYLELLDGLAVGNKAWVAARYASVGKAVKAIRLTMQPCGLTLAKPKWPVMYVMDNVETARGLRAAAHLATLAGRAADAKAWSAMAARMEGAIESSLWDADRDVYLVGLQPDGGRMTGHGEWYPDLMANLMSISWGRKSKRRADLYPRLVQKYGGNLPSVVKTEDDLDRLVWWGLAAKASGDSKRLKGIVSRIAATDLSTVPIDNPALLGAACRLTAANAK